MALPRTLSRRVLATSIPSLRPHPTPSRTHLLRPAFTLPASTRPQQRWHSAPSGPEFKRYDFQAIRELVEEPNSDRVLIANPLDVREPAEYAAGYIPTALNMPIQSQPDALFLSPEEFEDRLGFAKPPPNKEVVFYCKAGVRSSAAAQLARQNGYKNVGEYRGSWVDWVKNGGEDSGNPREEQGAPPSI
ncbi:Rhodanese-like protein [Trichodelitschia bisporula]|uniref:Rhodanese-like protein n=1 Tax=Trichodelitschia bisporula TaxID=703511 RepID=A0A6G1I171_9PEZI|nr:Rhodanese-like protein [Trichodelitschia bisporula]